MPYQNYNTFYLEFIKKILKASFVSWVDIKKEKALKVVVNKKEHLIPFSGEVTEETYKDLIEKLTKDEI